MPAAAVLSSKFAIGDTVVFNPDCNFHPGSTTTVLAKVVGIRFTESKVLYDLALACAELGGWYTALPLRDVDGIMVSAP